MKRIGISLLITITMLFSTSAYSFYNSNDMPMIKMMSVMMEMMSRMMMGGNSTNSAAPYALAPMGAMSGINGMTGLPMSPTNPLMSLYGGNTATNPWQNIPGTNLLTQQNPNQTNSPFAQQSFNIANKDDSMNGIWQALSGDILAIYYSNKFIWTDGKKRHLVGSLVIKGNQLSAYIVNQNKVIHFQFYRENNKFAVKDSSGQIHIFTRIH